MKKPSTIQIKSLLRKLIISSALAGVPLALHAEEAGSPKTLEEALAQIERLQRQMADLEKFVKTELSQKATPVTPPGTQPAPAQPSSATANTGATPAPSEAAGVPQNGFVKWNELMLSGSRLKLYGFLRGDFVYDDSRPGGNGANSSLVPAFVLSENGFGGAANQAPAPNHANLLFHPRLTRFGLDFSGPAIESLWGAKSGGKLEIDFYNLVAGGAESREYLRMRHGYASLRWDDVTVLAGQTSDVISQFFPSINPDFIMWGAGNVGDRRPQFRVEYTPKVGPGTFLMQTEVGLTGADDNRDLDNNGIRDGEASGFPTLQARLGYRLPLWEKQNLEIAGWIHYAHEKIDSPAAVSASFAAAGQTEFASEGYGVDLFVPIYRDILSLRGEIWTGRNLDDIRGGILQGINTSNARRIGATGGWAELMVRPSKRYSFHGGYTFDNPYAGDLPAQAPDLNRIWYLGSRFYFDPIEFGVDYLNWTTYFKDALAGQRGEGRDNRVQAYMSYKF